MANDRTQQALDLLRQAMGQAQVEFFAPLPFEAALPLLPVRARRETLEKQWKKMRNRCCFPVKKRPVLGGPQ